MRQILRYKPIFDYIMSEYESPNVTKDAERVQILRKYDSPYLRVILRANFDKAFKWDVKLYTERSMPVGDGLFETEFSTTFQDQVHKGFGYFRDPTVSQTRKQELYAELLMTLPNEDAIFLNKALRGELVYKRLIVPLIEEAFPGLLLQPIRKTKNYTRGKSADEIVPHAERLKPKKGQVGRPPNRKKPGRKPAPKKRGPKPKSKRKSTIKKSSES